MLRKVDLHLSLGLLEFSHQILVADIVDEVILGTDIMNAYGFVVHLRENVLKVGEEKIKLCMAKMTGSTNHSIKRVALVEEKVNRSGQEEPSLLQAEMEEELAKEIQISVTTKEVIGKPTMGVETRLLLFAFSWVCLLYTSRCV